MGFAHEKLDVYRLSIEFVHHSEKICKKLNWRHNKLHDQLKRASESIPQNIAEGNGKGSPADRRKYFEIARGSATECAASLDIINVYGVISSESYNQSKIILERIVAMLTKLGGRTFGISKPKS